MDQYPIRAKDGMHIYVNKESDPFYLFIDYDAKTEKLNMEFQHFHTFYEIMIITEKTAGHFIEGQFYNLIEGDIVLLKPGLLHKTVYFNQTPTYRFIINFRMDELARRIYSTKNIISMFDMDVPIIRLPLLEKNELLSKLYAICNNRKNSPDYQELETYSFFLSFLCTLYNNKDKNMYRNENFDQLTHKIFSITSYIHKNYAEQLNLEDLAEKFFISPCYLSRKFKEISGFSLIQYIQMTRIRNAQKMLLNTDDSIQMISENCGFTSFSQFNRVFDKYCEIPPSTFRKMSKDGEVELIKLNI